MHLSREAFQAYWFDTHGPLVASVAEALQIRRYVQTHSLPATDQGMEHIAAFMGFGSRLDFLEALESQLAEADVSCLFVSHDRYFTRAAATRFLEIRRGRLVEVEEPDTFFDSQTA